MTPISESYRKVPYDLRECKQVERRMLIDAFVSLAAAGVPIADYQYTGMGSVYFFDYLLFHRYLGISKMLSVEISSNVRKRVDFNRPFALVNTKIDSIGNVIPQLSRDVRHILWLDYDSTIVAGYVQDLVSALSRLSPGSIILITLDTEPPELPEEKYPGPRQWREYFYREVEDYLPRVKAKTTFARSNLVSLNIEIIKNAISRGMRSRTALTFAPLFCFDYRDGHRMITLGGMLCAEEDRRKLDASTLNKCVYYCPKFEPFEIKVPRFTRRERLYLDRAMPCKNSWIPKEFEASPDDIDAYRKIYRFLPNYAELLV